METQLRRHRHNLSIIGLGIILLGAWSVLKTVLYMAVSIDDWKKTLESRVVETDSVVIVYVVFAAVLVIDMAVRLFVGINARMAGEGKDRGSTYLVFAVFMLVFQGLSVISDVLVFNFALDAIISTLATVIFDLTAFVMLLELIVSGFRVRRLTSAKAAGHADPANAAAPAGHNGGA